MAGIVKVESPPVDNNVFEMAYGYFKTISAGMWKTWTIFIRQLSGIEKTNTLEWPEAPANYSNRFKGKHFLTRRPDGQVRCTACYLCATNCPAKCIHIEAGEHPSDQIEKYPVRFEIDILRCVFCGFCEEACPLDAIRLGPEFVMTGNTGQKWVYTKDYLADRDQLKGGIDSIKPATEKHPTTDTNQKGDAKITALARHMKH